LRSALFILSERRDRHEGSPGDEVVIPAFRPQAPAADPLYDVERLRPKGGITT
jgi:hypothetical protein